MLLRTKFIHYYTNLMLTKTDPITRKCKADRERKIKGKIKENNVRIIVNMCVGKENDLCKYIM